MMRVERGGTCQSLKKKKTDSRLDLESLNEPKRLKTKTSVMAEVKLYHEVLEIF